MEEGISRIFKNCVESSKICLNCISTTITGGSSNGYEFQNLTVVKAGVDQLWIVSSISQYIDPNHG